MNKIIILLVVAGSFLFASCGSMALTPEAKKRYLEKEKLEADAYAYAQVKCNEKLIENKMMQTRSDMSLRKAKNENFKFRLEFTKYIDAKFKGDTNEINRVYDLMEELGPELSVCREAQAIAPPQAKTEGK